MRGPREPHPRCLLRKGHGQLGYCSCAICWRGPGALCAKARAPGKVNHPERAGRRVGLQWEPGGVPETPSQWTRNTRHPRSPPSLLFPSGDWRSGSQH